MKKYLLLCALFLNLLPQVENMQLTMQIGSTANAQNMGGEAICRGSATGQPILVQSGTGWQIWTVCYELFYCETGVIAGDTECEDEYIEVPLPPDCNGDPGGDAYLDWCGCVGGNTGVAQCQEEGEEFDCNGDYMGSAYEAECGCIGGNTGIDDCDGLEPPAPDCNGDPGGSAYWIGGCGCVGGNTGVSPSFCNPPPPPSCTLNASLASIPTTMQPCSSVHLQVNLGQIPSGVTVTEYRYQAQAGPSNWQDLDDPNNYSTNSLNYNMRVMGHISFRVQVSYTCGNESYEILSNEVSTSVNLCVLQFQQEFATHMNQAWQYTLNATATGYGKWEYGFVGEFDGTAPIPVYQTSQPFTNIEDCSNLIQQTGYMVTTLGTYGPVNGEQFQVGVFHTHPPITNCSSGVIGTAGPSSIDYNSNPPFPGVVRDYITQHNGGHDPNEPTKYYYYGPSCTNYY